jgi:hypothetical protein
MKRTHSLALAALAAPTLALAQPTYYYRSPPRSRARKLRECMYRDEDLTRRDTALAAEKRPERPRGRLDRRAPPPPSPRTCAGWTTATRRRSRPTTRARPSTTAASTPTTCACTTRTPRHRA